MDDLTNAPLTRQTYNLGEVATLLGVSQRYCYTLAQENRLPGVVKFGGRWLLPRSKLAALLESGTDVAPAVPVEA